jgi:hypothetical protein
MTTVIALYAALVSTATAIFGIWNALSQRRPKLYVDLHPLATSTPVNRYALGSLLKLSTSVRFLCMLTFSESPAGDQRVGIASGSTNTLVARPFPASYSPVTTPSTPLT